jgi:hypothetical protein
MNMIKLLLVILSLPLMPSEVVAQSLAQQWIQGLSGTRLTAYSGSVVSSNSSLTVINFCRNGRYSYSTDASWSVPGYAGGASNGSINGQWDIQENYNQVYLVYRTDQGQQGSFPIYLQNNGKVNIGGAAYSAQQNASGC